MKTIKIAEHEINVLTKEELLVEGLRDPVFAQDLPHHLVVTLEGFLLLEAEPHHGSGGVVYGPVEGGFRESLPEPIVYAGVDLQQLPEALPSGP